MPRPWRVARLAAALAPVVCAFGCESLPGDRAAELTLAIARHESPYIVTIGESHELEWAVLTRDGRDITELYGMAEFVFLPHEPAVARVRYTYNRAYADALSTGHTILELRLPAEQLVTDLELTVVP